MDGHSMDPKHTSVETIRQEVGFWNTDVAAGWEVGLQGKERVGRSLHNRLPPDHLREPKNASRLVDWLAGRDAAQRYRAREVQRFTHFVGQKPDGVQIMIERKGWVARGPVVTRLQRLGCTGDVKVIYFDNHKIVRTVDCGI